MLFTPYLFNPEYLEHAPPGTCPRCAPHLNSFNVAVWRVYIQFVKSGMVKEVPGAFDYLIQAYFPGSGSLEIQYIFEAFLVCNDIHNEYMEKKAERERIIKDAEKQLKERRGPST